MVQSKKRKSITKDFDLNPTEISDDLENVDLNGVISDSDDASFESGSESDGGLLLEEAIEHEDVEYTGEDNEEDEEDEEDEEEEDDEIRNQIKAIKSLTEEDEEDDVIDKRMRDLEVDYTITEDANGNPRYEYREIDPVYESDDSDAQEPDNTIGDIPLSYYDAYPHIGYDINGKKIMRPAVGEALDALLDSIEIPKGWTGLTDPSTGKPLQLSQEELEVLKKITRNEVVEDGYDPYPDMVEYFTSKTEIMPLSGAPEPKRRFVPSKNEAKRVMKIVRAIKEGRIKPFKPITEGSEEDETHIQNYDLWADEAPQDRAHYMPAPKMPPPGYEDSYHPPPEYLPDKEEKAAWDAQDPEDREKDYLPTDYDALRKVPGYDNVKPVFERCLDLYLAPRMRRNKLNIDPESLLPKLPSPEELRPFPTACASIFKGHQGRVRSVSVDPSGTLVATGGDDGTVRIWELFSGRPVWTQKLSSEDAVDVVKWRPGTDAIILAASCGHTLYFIVPYGIHTLTPALETASCAVLDSGFGYAAKNPKSTASSSTSTKSDAPALWMRPLSAKLLASGVLLSATVRSTIKVLAWHRRGDYIASLAPKGASHAIAIHALSKHHTQLPFRKLKGLPQSCAFHPLKPILFVADQRVVRAYDLAAQALVRKLVTGARWLSCLDVHPRSGDHVLVGSYDRRVAWHDTDLASTPYKTLRYHDKAVRAVKFHPGGYPLFADASDDGTVQIFHGKVVDDLMENATIVPLKVLRGHRIKGALGVFDVDWHPKLPWCVSVGADGTGRLWT